MCLLNTMLSPTSTTWVTRGHSVKVKVLRSTIVLPSEGTKYTHESSVISTLKLWTENQEEKKKTSWNNAFPIIPRGRGGGIMGTSLSCSRQSQTCWIILCAKQFSMSCMDKHLFTDLISLKIIWCIYINQWTFDVLLLEYQIPSGKRIALSWNLRFCKASSMIVRILQNKYKQNLMTAHDRNHLPVSHQCIL